MNIYCVSYHKYIALPELSSCAPSLWPLIAQKISVLSIAQNTSRTWVWGWYWKEAAPLPLLQKSYFVRGREEQRNEREKKAKSKKERKFKLKKLSKCGWVTFSQRAFTCLIHSLDLANFHSISARSYIGLMICERQECEPRGRRAADMKQKKQKRYGKRWNKIYIF